MLKNYLIVAFRNLKRNKVYSFINVFGLAVGMACCIVIMLFVRDELSYDRFHENAGRIYRLTIKRTTPGQEFHHTITLWDMGPNLVNDFPEVVDDVRLTMHRWFVVERGEKRFTTDPVFADPNILNTFSFALLRGDKDMALKEPNSVVISEDLAKKFFAEEDPMGKLLTIYDTNSRYDLQITGIMKNIPYNSHLRFEFLAPLKHLETRKGFDRSQRHHCVTYLLLDKNASPEELEKKFPDFIFKHYGERVASGTKFILQPLTAIHLHSDLDYDEIVEKKGDISASYSLSAVALVIMLIACINFVNLSTARASRRSREVGMRKVVGAGKRQLFGQFLGEAIFLSFIALFLAVLVALFLLPFFNSLMGKHLTLNLGENLFLYLSLILLCLLVGFLSGFYPAIVLSSFRPAEVLRSDFRKTSLLGVFMRKGLVIFQFAVSLVFIIGTIIIFKQLNYVKNKDLGYDKDNIVVIPIFKDRALAQRPELIKRELSQHSNILKAVVTEGTPTYSGHPIKCLPEGFTEDNPVEMNEIPVGENFFDFFGIKIIEGRDFSKEMATDADSAAIINQTAAKSLGWESPIGKQIKSTEFGSETNKTGSVTVIGVVKNFHSGSLHEKIKPSIFRFWPSRYSEVYLRIRPENIKETIAFLEKKWRELPTHLIFYYHFLDDSLEINFYGEDRKVSKIFTFSSILAVVLACLGLFGLASFSAERRTKEIGIRKVLGASVSNIAFHFAKDFSILTLIANVIACPAGYFVMNRWLQNFAYRIGISWWAFVAAFLFVFLITILTIGFQSIKAATLNPATTLRYE
jgi:putative ABC transport system permease protein